ncbi:MAG: hypothetical protein U0556_03895 [Dehalococcoidia bacterium]
MTGSSNTTSLPGDRYRFFYNPYTEYRFSRCPICQGKTRSRKVPLAAAPEPNNLYILNLTCRYCLACDLLIAHQDLAEELLDEHFERVAPHKLGSKFDVVGTLDPAAWRAGKRGQLTSGSMLEALLPFRERLEFRPADH